MARSKANTPQRHLRQVRSTPNMRSSRPQMEIRARVTERRKVGGQMTCQNVARGICFGVYLREYIYLPKPSRIIMMLNPVPGIVTIYSLRQDSDTNSIRPEQPTQQHRSGATYQCDSHEYVIPSYIPRDPCPHKESEADENSCNGREDELCYNDIGTSMTVAIGRWRSKAGWRIRRRNPACHGLLRHREANPKGLGLLAIQEV